MHSLPLNWLSQQKFCSVIIYKYSYMLKFPFASVIIFLSRHKSLRVAKATVGEHACYHSMVQSGGGVYFLGVNGVWASKVHTWKERVNLARNTGHTCALKLALSFYDGTAKAVVGK